MDNAKRNTAIEKPRVDHAHPSGARLLALSAGAATRYHWKAALACFLAVAACGLLVGYVLPRHFTATADLWLDRGSNVSYRSDPVIARNTELRLLTSGELIGRTVDALGLDRLRGIGQPRDGPLRDRASARAGAIAVVGDHLRANANGTSYSVSLSASASDPAVAAAVANRLADLYVADRRDASGGDQTLLALQARVAAARETAVRSRAAEIGYRSAATAVTGDNAISSQSIRQLDAQIAEARTAAAVARARLQAADSTAEGTTTAVLELEQRQAQRVAEGDTPTPEIDRRLEAERRRLDRLKRSAEGTAALLAQIVSSRDLANRSRDDAGRTVAQLASLKATADQDEMRYASQSELLRRQSAAVQVNQSTAYVISHAVPGSATAAPDRLTILLASLAAAAVATTLLLLTLERLQAGFRTEHALEAALGLPVIGTVRDLSRDRSVVLSDNRLAVPNYLVQHRSSAFSQRFDAILARLRYDAAGERSQVLAISSALPEEGKTTVALCLARAAATNGVRTILIDCDIRRPAVSHALFPTLEAGLTDVLRGSLSLAEATRRDEASGAEVLGIGSRRSPNLSIDANELGGLLASLRETFDVVILDTPPALALSEARQVAALADAVLLVARFRRTPADAVKIAHDLLTRAGAAVTATILTLTDR